jgi:putative acyl-CoA dehydrogenase
MPATVEAFFAELAAARGANAALDRWVAALKAEFADLGDLEYRARHLVDRMALAIQAALLVQHAPAYVADAFCASRLEGVGDRQFGTLPRGADCAAIIDRATPRA